MKMSLLVLAGAVSFGMSDVSAYGLGWVESGISPYNPVAAAKPVESAAFDGSLFDQKPFVTDSWTPVRVGLGGSSHSTTNCVWSLPWVWTNVYGIQAELVSCACDVYGVQACLLGVGNDICGLQGSLGNYAFGDVYGIQCGVAFSLARRMTGIQIDGCCSMADEMTGIQVGGLASGARTSARGLQVAALVNAATDCDGFQIGLFNFADTGTVVQIGLWNVYGAEGADDRRMLPVVNVGW